MKNKIIKKMCAAAVLACVSGPALAWAPYFSAGGSLGLGLGHDSARGGGFSGAAGVRYKISDVNMRTEIEYSKRIYEKEYKYTTADGEHHHDYDLNTDMYLLNVFVDPQMPLTHSGLHIGATAGAVTYRRDLPDFIDADDKTKTTFVYGASAGLGLHLLIGLHADVGVRYLRTLDDDVMDSISPYINIRYGF